MSDATRTPREKSEDLFEELKIIARCGLLPGELLIRRDQLPAAFGLNRVQKAGSDPHLQALSLIQLVVDAVGRMPGEQLAAEADAHFGVQARHRDETYHSRRVAAADIWRSDYGWETENYTRREFPKVRMQLANTILELDGKSVSSVSDTGFSAAMEDEKAVTGLKRVDCRLESWLTGVGQQQLRSEWTANDLERKAAYGGSGLVVTQDTNIILKL